MSTTAQLLTHARNVDHPHHVPVLLAEERHGTTGQRILVVTLGSGHGQIGQDRLRNALLDIGSLALRADWYSRSKTYFDVANDPGLTQNKYGLLDARATLDLADGQTSISLWIKNWLDRTYVDGTANLRTSAGFDQIWWGWPRRYGIEVTRRF